METQQDCWRNGKDKKCALVACLQVSHIHVYKVILLGFFFCVGALSMHNFMLNMI